MSILNQLALDHFFITCDSEQFSELLHLKTLLQGVTHREVRSGNDHWEGVYIRTRTGAYIELLKERKIGKLGLAISPAQPFYSDASKIMSEFPNLAWKQGTRILEDGQPWFDWYTAAERADIDYTLLDAWLMRYHLSHRATLPPITACSVDRAIELNVTLGEENAKDALSFTGWLPGTKEVTSSDIIFNIPDREGSTFSIRVDLVAGREPFVFRSLRMATSPQTEVKSVNLGKLELVSKKGEIILREESVKDHR